jgi:hypothetical protein
MESGYYFVEPYWFMLFWKIIKSNSLTKIWLTAHFAELTIVRTKPNCSIVQRNGGGTYAYSSENEARGMDVHLGVEGSNSNGHGEEIDKEVEHDENH